MIPTLKMGYYHQREDLERTWNIQMGEKLTKKPLKESMEGLEYPSLLSSKTYSVLSYIVGGFVGSKSQMNNNKHNLSYDLSAAIFNLLNPCKYEREKGFRKSSENFYNTTCKLNSEVYDKYIVKSSHKEKMVDLELEWLENYILGCQKHCYDDDHTRNNLSHSYESRVSCDKQSTMDTRNLGNCLEVSDLVNKHSADQNQITEKECLNHFVNYLSTARFRQQSECSIESTDSESFIIFDGPDQDDERRTEESWKLENLDLGSEDGSADDIDEDSSCDEYDICSVDKELAEANDKWKRHYENVETLDDEGQRKVRFNDDVKINRIVAWEYAYRAARPGPWEQMARDRVRFRERILRLSPTLSAILSKEHRDKIYRKLYS